MTDGTQRAPEITPDLRLRGERPRVTRLIYGGRRRMVELKLGRLPKVGLVRMTIGIPEPLKEKLDRYAAEHSRLYEPVDAATLIPHMLDAFIRSDRGYRSRRSQSERGKARQRSGSAPSTTSVAARPDSDGSA